MTGGGSSGELCMQRFRREGAFTAGQDSGQSGVRKEALRRLQEFSERGAFRQQSGCGCHRHGGKYALRLGDICGESIPCGGNESSRRNVITFDIKGKRGR